MFGSDHYVPILKTKSGEMWALAHIKTRSRNSVTPLLELHAHKSLDNVTHASNVCQDIDNSWGKESPFFLDTVWLHSQERVGIPHIVQNALNSARNCGLKAIPVVRLGYGTPTLNVIRDAVAADGRGCLVRVGEADLGSQHAIESVVAEISVSKGNVDFMIDYGKKRMSLHNDVPRVPDVTSWRTLSSASGSFPRSLSDLALGEWHELQRSDWNSWAVDSSIAGLPRYPSFADYTIRDTSAPPAGGNPSAVLKYARTPHWLVRVGGKHKEGHAPDIYEICSDLVSKPDFDGADFSAGDNEIYQRSNQSEVECGPGGPTDWLQWGISHHIEFVVQQIHAA